MYGHSEKYFLNLSSHKDLNHWFSQFVSFGPQNNGTLGICISHGRAKEGEA